MIRGFLPVLLIAAAVPGGRLCAQDGVPNEIPDAGPAAGTDARARLDSFISEVGTLTADFTQETWSVDQELVETATGRFSLLRPARFVWHYDSPFEQLVVADGETLWMHDVELEQVTRTPLDSVAAGNPAFLLSSERSVGEDFSVARSYTVDDLEMLELVPHDPLADFSRVLVGFRGEAPVLIEIVDGLNQTTRVEFSGIELNAEIDPADFEFEPPPNAHVMGDE